MMSKLCIFFNLIFSSQVQFNAAMQLFMEKSSVFRNLWILEFQLKDCEK